MVEVLFWPASRKNNPKQLLNIVGKTTMLQMTVDRFQKMKNVEDLTIAIPKGRVLKETLPILKTIGIIPECEFFDKEVSP